MKVRYAGNRFDEKQLYAAIKCITENWWVLGDKGLQFQKWFSKVAGRKYGVFVNSGSSANLLAIYYAKKLGYKKVITPVCGFPTTINPIIQFGLDPIFIDIDKDNLNLSIGCLQKAAKENPGSVLFFAHALGNPPKMHQVMRIVFENNLYLIQDCCDALGSKYDMRKLGTFGKLSTYSFYPAHHMSTGEGGFIATDEYEVYKTLVSFRDWGRDCTCRGKRDAMKENGRCNHRYGNWLPGNSNLNWDHKYTYSEIGFNLKPLQLQAVIGLQQIKKLSQFQRIRSLHYIHLNRNIDNSLQYLKFPSKSIYANVCWFSFPISVQLNSPFSRQDLINYLQENGIQTRLYFAGNILYQPAYKQIVNKLFDGDYSLVKKMFPDANYVTQNTFFIGLSQVMSTEEVGYMCDKINQFISGYSK